MKTLTIMCNDAQASHVRAFIELLNRNRSSIPGSPIHVRERTADDYLEDIKMLIDATRAEGSESLANA